MMQMDEITLTDVCQYKHIDKLKPETKKVMVQSPQSFQRYLNKALMQEFNSNLFGVCAGLLDNKFTAEQATEVIYAMPAHRDTKGNEIERAVSRIFNAEFSGESTESAWPLPKEVKLPEVMSNLKLRGIEPMSEDEMTEILGESPEEADNAVDFIKHYFNGLDNPPVYIGGQKHGAIQHASTWLTNSETIEAYGYDQVLANPMKRLLTAEERASIPSGGRRAEFFSETMDVITFESDALKPEEQLAVIAWIARYLPLVSIVYSGGKSYHATFSLKGLSREQVDDVRQTLHSIGGDRSVMAPHQLVRLGGVNRNDAGGKLQRVLWIDPYARTQSVEAGNLAELMREPVDDVDDLECYHHNGKFYLLDSLGEKYIAITSTDLTRRLRRIGHSNRGDNGQLSAVDLIKDNIIDKNTVDHVGPIAGRSIGLARSRGISHLISRKNERTEAMAGDWGFIRSLIDDLFGDQAKFIYSWLHRSRCQLNEERYMQGHVLAIAGAAGGGKSLFAQQIAIPMLGIEAKASLYLTGETPFNADLVGAEVQLMDDDFDDTSAKGRSKLGSNLKALSAGSKSVSCHGKGVNAYRVNPLWRAIVCMNDDEQALKAFPPLGEGSSDSIGDKVLLLKCHQTELPFARDPEQSSRIEGAIADEISAFAHFIDGYDIPADIKKGFCRFGFDEFHHPELLQTLNQDSNERTLLSITDKVLFRDEFNMGVMTCTTTGRRYWQGTAIEWADTLLNSSAVPHKVRSTIEGELAFGGSKVKAGKKLKGVASVSDGRVTRRENSKGIIWTVWDDIDLPENNPF